MTGLLNGDSVTNVALTSSGSVSNAAAGNHPIIASGALGTGLTNYTIGYSNGTLTVMPANLVVVTAGSTNKPYGATLNFAGTEFTVTGLLNGDTVTNVTLTSAGAVSNAPVGTYAVVPGNAQGSGTGNYSLNYSNGTVTVSPVLLTITAGNTNKIYGGSISFDGSEFTTAGLLNGDSVTNVSLSSTGAGSNAPAGSYPIVVNGASGTGLTNYFLFYNYGVLNVGLANITVTASSTNKVYGSDHAFAGTEFTVTGLLNGDTITNLTLASTGAATNSPVGIYPVTAVNPQGAGASNYSIFINYGLLTVTPASLTVTASNAAKAVGATLNFAGTEFAVAGLMNSDTVGGATLGSAGAPAGAAAGTYPITVTNVSGSGISNYSVGYIAGVLTVTNLGLFEITSITVSGGVATLTWNSVSNQSYVLQYKDDLAGANWIEVPVTIPATGLSTSTTNVLGGAPQRFYRVRLGTAAAPAPAPQITSIVPGGGNVIVTWTSVAGHFYRLQYNDNLTTTNWTDVLPEVTAAGSASSVTNSVAGVDQRFYRVWLRE